MLNTLKNKKFLPLLLAHACAGLNDNLIKNIFVFLAAYQFIQSSSYWFLFAFLLYGAAFGVSTLIFGPVADKMSRTTFIHRVKMVEVVVMTLTSIGLLLSSRMLILVSLVGIACCTAAIRVVKYALVPNLVDKKELLSANALLKACTFVMSLLATLAILIPFQHVAPTEKVVHIMAVGMILLSVLGMYAAGRIAPVKPADPDTSAFPVASFVPKITHWLEDHADVRFYVASVAWYWLLGGVVILFAPAFVRELLVADKSVLLYLTMILSVGYVVGALSCVQLYRSKIAGYIVPLTAVLLSVFLADCVFVSSSIGANPQVKTMATLMASGWAAWHLCVDIFLLGAVSACFIVPFYPLLQSKTENNILGRVMSYTTLACWLALFGSSLIVWTLDAMNVSLQWIFLALAFINLFMAVYACQLLPEDSRRRLMRYFLAMWCSFDVEGLEQLDKLKGKRVLIVANHTSYLDVLLISVALQRKITLALKTSLAGKWWVRLFCNLVEIKALEPDSPWAVKVMAQELTAGKLCMILPEGIIRDGNTRMQIYEGPALMALAAKAYVLPIQITGASHTLFSRIRHKTYVQWHPHVQVKVLPGVDFSMGGKGVFFHKTRMQVATKLYDILSRMVFATSETHQTFFEAIIKTQKMVGRRKEMMEDTARKPMKFQSLFLKAFVLAGLFKKAFADDKMVGVLLPTSNACAVTILGLHALGKTPAMINFSSGIQQVLATCKTVKLKTLVCAHKVVSLGKLETLIEALEKAGYRIVYLEDLAKGLTLKDKLLGVYGMLFPLRRYRQLAPDAAPSDTSAVLFTSGSEGMPKAVILSHENFISNVLQVPSRIDIDKNDIMLCCLPTFHSFGLMAGIYAPLILGLKTVLYPTPLHYRIIPGLCASARATIFFATDTFLSNYAKCAQPYDFNTLRIVAAGAEKLREETKQVWADKFGIRLIEGYGATECSPILALNTHLHMKAGTVGRLITGMECKLKPVPGIRDGAELVVRGPNVMQGYMKYDKPGVLQPPKDGWYETGDIVHIDDEGFIAIRGRAKRFAKIGGEMVSLLAVEQVIHNKWQGGLSGVVNIPDPKKGEQLVLITNLPDLTHEQLVTAFREAGMTELAVPKKIIVTPEPPVLETGKFNYVAATELAQKELNQG